MMKIGVVVVEKVTYNYFRKYLRDISKSSFSLCLIYLLKMWNFLTIGFCPTIIKQKQNVNMIRSLDAIIIEGTKQKQRITVDHSLLQDIRIFSSNKKFTFHYAPRMLLSVVDQLAKQSRISNQKYVISWQITKTL